MHTSFWPAIWVCCAWLLCSNNNLFSSNAVRRSNSSLTSGGKSPHTLVFLTGDRRVEGKKSEWRTHIYMLGHTVWTLSLALSHHSKVRRMWLCHWDQTMRCVFVETYNKEETGRWLSINVGGSVEEYVRISVGKWRWKCILVCGLFVDCDWNFERSICKRQRGKLENCKLKLKYTFLIRYLTSPTRHLENFAPSLARYLVAKLEELRFVSHLSFIKVNGENGVLQGKLVNWLRTKMSRLFLTLTPLDFAPQRKEIPFLASIILEVRMKIFEESEI